MTMPLPNEEALYTRIKEEGIGISSDIWDLLYERIGDDVTAINLLCQYHLNNDEPIPVSEAGKILTYTRHIKKIVNEITVISKDNFPFPEFASDIPLHPIIREMFTHYIGNDIHVIGLIVTDAIDPAGPYPLSLDTIKKILNRTDSIKNFMNKLQQATANNKPIKPKLQPDNIKKEYTKEELFFKIRGVIANELKIDENRIKPESRFAEDLGIDLIDALRIMMTLEYEFGFEIPDDDIDKISTFNDAVDYILERLKSLTNEDIA